MKKLFFLCLTIFIFAGVALRESQAQKKTFWVSPKTGVWQLSGNDEEKTFWKARLHLTRKSQSQSIVHYKGYFSWRSSDGKTAGREYFTGVFNRNSGKLNLKSYAVKNVRGELGKGRYTGFVSRQGRIIKRGSWAGDDVVKGIWTAKWVRKS